MVKSFSWDYSSPEQKQMTKRPRDHSAKSNRRNAFILPKIDGRTDLYSVGLILYEILTHKPWAYIRQPPAKLNKFVPQRLSDIVMGLLESDQNCRMPSAEALIAELECV